jgi:hypothetical protein
MNLFSFLLILVCLISLSSAATCAEKSYSISCQKCTFDSNGKMDQTCYSGYQESGKLCLFAAYPLESIAYTNGECPAIDTCVDRLQTCKAFYASGNDSLDCESGQIDHCFTKADACVAAAVKNCTGTPPGDVANLAPPPAWCDGIFFLLILPFGALFYCKSK